MRYHQAITPELITLSPRVPPRGSVVWLHGLGADGSDFVPLVEELSLPETCPLRFLFPNAPTRPITINNGYAMPAWYDIRSFGGDDDDDAGIRASETTVRALLQREIDGGIAAGKIVLAGFSQGGAVALHTGARYITPLAGVLALSTYLPLPQLLATEAQPPSKATPILMCHGTHDDIVPLQAGERSCAFLRQLGYDVTWKTYDMQHEVALEEVEDIREWLLRRMSG
ncbi:MAG: alpha/beta hydrolase [Steroidobacteraceae bacterium]